MGGCSTGEAKISPGFRLPTRYVIHTVGPVWSGGQRNEAAILASCYRNSFDLARRHGVRSIAFPSISTGVYGYPKDEAARIALAVMREYQHRFDDIIACCFSAADQERYERLLAIPAPGATP